MRGYLTPSEWPLEWHLSRIYIPAVWRLQILQSAVTLVFQHRMNLLLLAVST